MAATLEQTEASGYVYFLADPRTPRHPRYVGTTKDVAERRRRHASYDRANAPLNPWKSELRSSGLSPVLYIVGKYPSPEAARAAEWRLIRRWQRRGLCDLNFERGNADSQRLEWANRHATRSYPRGDSRNRARSA